MDETEAECMSKHAAYWRDHLDRGKAIVFGPVMDPVGARGLADPVIAAGVCTFELCAIDAVVRATA